MEYHRDCQCCALHRPHCPSLGTNAPGYTGLWASQELMNTQKGKLIAFSEKGLLAVYACQVLSDHLPIHCSVSVMLSCWSFFFSTTLQNRPVLEWPLDERLTVTLLVAQYTWKRRGQRADFCLEVSSAFLPGRSEEQKRRCTTPHGCPTPFSHKSVSPEAEKGRRHTANYALWGNLLLYFLMYSLTGGKSLLANTKLTLLPKGASLNY